MGLLDRLFGRTAQATSDPLLARALERAAELVEPRLKLARDWQTRLAPGVTAAIDVARDVALRLQTTHELAPECWADDATLRALLPAADSVAPLLSRARELQRFLRTHPRAGEACAVLDTGFQIKQVYGAALVDGVLRQDVALEQAEFGDPQLRVVAADLESLQQAVGSRVFNDLMLAATRRLADADKRGNELNVTRAMLQARLRLLDAREDTLLDRGSEAAPDDAAAEIAELQLRLQDIQGAIEATGRGVDGLDRQLDLVRDTLLAARASIVFEQRRLRLDAMNRVVPAGVADGRKVVFEHAQSAGRSQAFVAVRVQRAAVPADGLALAAVERAL
ncbi:MAG: hypothetical protein U5L03_03880 [Burkholderiaceae bacterium]|nr:hypothetical protein [Burkholderiaceae bacterium]